MTPNPVVHHLVSTDAEAPGDLDGTNQLVHVDAAPHKVTVWRPRVELRDGLRIVVRTRDAGVAPLLEQRIEKRVPIPEGSQVASVGEGSDRPRSCRTRCSSASGRDDRRSDQPGDPCSPWLPRLRTAMAHRSGGGWALARKRVAPADVAGARPRCRSDRSHSPPDRLSRIPGRHLHRRLAIRVKPRRRGVGCRRAGCFPADLLGR